MVYLVTFQIRFPNTAFRINQALAQFPAWAHYMNDMWFIKAPGMTAEDVFNFLRPHMGVHDLLFVTRVHKGEFFGFMNKEVWPWLDENADY